VSPAHHSGQGRLVVLVVVLAVLVGVALAARTPSVADPGGPPVSPAAFVTAPGAESSAWYCTGQSTAAGGISVGTLVLTNSTGRTVIGSVQSISDTGAQAQITVTVPAHSQLVPDLPAPSSGSWTSQVVIMSAGGVAVTQAVHGPTGWSETSCQSRTSADWYFPSGTTSGADGLFLSLFNPTTSPDVVDLTFVTPSGVLHPINFQGLVLQPGQVQVADVAAFVQEQSAVATVVGVRTGRVVASEVQQFTGPQAGLSIVPGAPAAESRWSIPQSDEVSGGSSEIDVFNPGSATEHVTVQIRLPTGPVAPLTRAVAPLSTWVLSTSAQTRIPVGDPYSSEVVARGGSGVVVGRLVEAPSSAPSPHSGLANAVEALSSSWPSRQWLVPSPGSTAMPAYAGALPEHLALANTGGRTEHVVVRTMTPSGTRIVATETLRPHQGISIGGATLFSAGLYPLLVRSSGPVAVSEDVGPAGAFGVITLPGIAMASAG
jgi:hypothetical protein